MKVFCLHLKKKIQQINEPIHLIFQNVPIKNTRGSFPDDDLANLLEYIADDICMYQVLHAVLVRVVMHVLAWIS
jgi:hypothetical protein